MRRWAAAIAAGLVAASVLVVTPASADAIRDREYWLTTYGISQAWATTKGAGQVIAIIDTGVDRNVPELKGAVIGGADFSGIGTSQGTPVGDDDQHGTLVASLAAGRGTGPDTGVIGAAPEASILAISIGFGEGGGSSDDEIAEAVRWAVDNGATVINMSLTRNTLDWPESWDDAFLYAAENDVVVVAAAGNRGSGTTVVGAPAAMPGVLTVAGVDVQGKASFDASSQGITVGVSAPSENLVGVLPGGQIAQWNGTSGAAPIVSGIVALVRAAHPNLDAANVINRIVSTAKEAGASGFDPIYGYGLVDAAAAVSSRVPVVDANPMGDLAEWVRIYRRADSTPVPVPSGEAAPAPVPETTPEVISVVSPLGVILPTVNQLRAVGIPLGVVVVFGSLAVWFTVAGVRRFRAGRQQE